MTCQRVCWIVCLSLLQPISVYSQTSTRTKQPTIVSTPPSYYYAYPLGRFNPLNTGVYGPGAYTSYDRERAYVGDVFEPWPLVSGDIFSWPYVNQVEQPTGHVTRWTSPNGNTYSPVYGPQMDREEPLWKIARQAEAGLTTPLYAPLLPSPLERDWNKAVASFQQGHYDEARQTLDELLRHSPKHGPAWFLQVQASLALGDSRTAAAALRRGMTLLPMSQWGQIVQAKRQYYGRLVDLAEHIQSLEKRREIAGATSDSLLVLAFEYAQLGYKTDALKRLEMALELSPADPACLTLWHTLSPNRPPPGPKVSKQSEEI